jgi:hypothetical protein
MRQQAGFVGSRIHEGVSRAPSRFVEFVEWDSLANFVAAAVTAETSGVRPAVEPTTAEVYVEAGALTAMKTVALPLRSAA